jgi:cysteine desulfurase
MEHPSIRIPAANLAREGFDVVRIPPGPDGVVPAETFADALTDGTILACLMLANNELGTLQPVPEVARTCRERGVPLLVDAVQAVGKIPIDVATLGADYVVLGAHKFHGPPGAAALWLGPGATFDPLLVGGGQERGRRAATENVAALVGLGEAARLAAEELPEREHRLRALRDRFEEGLARIPDAVVHCAGSPRLPQTSHVAFPGAEGESLLLRLDLAGFAVSTGSACSSGRVEPSATLLAMGVAPREALASIRVSFGISNTPAEVDAFLETLGREVATLRRLTA